MKYEAPDLAAVPVEWVSQKHSKGTDTAARPSSKREQLQCLIQDTTTDLVILHVHGGALLYTYCLLVLRCLLTIDAVKAALKHTSELASLTGGRVVSVKYRLAPQSPFPAGLLDVLVVYFSLLYPAPSSAHRAVDPSHIVFAGDSMGGQLVFGLLQIIKQSISLPSIFAFTHMTSPRLSPSPPASLP